jgi:hypothetical protein
LVIDRNPCILKVCRMIEFRKAYLIKIQKNK